MKVTIKTFVVIVISILHFKGVAQKGGSFKPKVVYKTNDLVITQIAKNAYEHTSFKQTQDFGYVPCNGMVVRNAGETIVFDTPTNDSSAEKLIKWIQETLGCNINAIIPTHFHDDCLGGLKAFDDHNIPSFGYLKTIELAKANGYLFPKNSFSDSLVLNVGHEKIIAKYLGEGHTKDNIVGYSPGENLMFGGCLIKALDAGKGYLGDANVAEWSNTVERVKKAFPGVKTVIPGHGDFGDVSLLDYTIKLFRVQ